MEFIFETTYNKEALTVMAKALRKTVRKKKSRRSHIFGWIVAALGAFLAIESHSDISIGLKNFITWFVVAILIFVLLLEDHINGHFAQKRMLPGTEKAAAVFTEAGYITTTEAGKTEWSYERIGWLAETDDYFVFVFNVSHAQIYDKRNLTGGTADEFRSFIESVTGKTAQRIK